MLQNRSTQRDRFAAEQDFKVNLKSELMLDDLTRHGRERNAQMEELVGVMKEIQGRNEVENQDRMACGCCQLRDQNDHDQLRAIWRNL